MPTDVGGRKVYQLESKSEDLDGVRRFSPRCTAIAHSRLPERCANLRVGGPENTRLCRLSCHSVDAMCVESHGAT